MRYFFTAFLMSLVLGQTANAASFTVDSRFARIFFFDNAGCTGAFSVSTNDVDVAFDETRAGSCNGVTGNGNLYSGNYETSHYSVQSARAEILVDIDTEFLVSEIDSANQPAGGTDPRFRLFTNSRFDFTVDEVGAGQIEFNQVLTSSASSPFAILQADGVTVYNSNSDPDFMRFVFSPGVNYRWLVNGAFDTGLSDFLLASSIATRLKIETDNDMLADFEDNCINAANIFQQDTDGDGFGNICDADLDNNCIVNFLDFSIMSDLFLSNDPEADLNSDGVVNFLDFAIFNDLFLNPPGPSGVANICDQGN